MSKITQFLQQIDGEWVREANLVNHYTKKHSEHLSFHSSDWDSSSLVFIGWDTRNEWGTTLESTLKTSIKIWQFITGFCYRWNFIRIHPTQDWEMAQIQCNKIKKWLSFCSKLIDFHQKWTGKSTVCALLTPFLLRFRLQLKKPARQSFVFKSQHWNHYSHSKEKSKRVRKRTRRSGGDTKKKEHVWEDLVWCVSNSVAFSFCKKRKVILKSPPLSKAHQALQRTRGEQCWMSVGKDKGQELDS